MTRQVRTDHPVPRACSVASNDEHTPRAIAVFLIVEWRRIDLWGGGSFPLMLENIVLRKGVEETIGTPPELRPSRHLLLFHFERLGAFGRNAAGGARSVLFGVYAHNPNSFRRHRRTFVLSLVDARLAEGGVPCESSTTLRVSGSRSGSSTKAGPTNSKVTHRFSCRDRHRQSR